MDRVIQTVIIFGIFSGLGCSHYLPKEHTLAEVRTTEAHAEEVALARLSDSFDLDTARTARRMVRERATR